MVKEKINLSDWIQFLISQKNHAYALILGLASLIVGLTLIGFWYLDNSQPEGFFITLLFSFIIAFFMVFVFCYEKSVLNRPKILLNEIIAENKTDVMKIKEEWFGGRKTMDYSLYSKEFSYAGIIFLIIGVIFAAISYVDLKAVQWASTFFAGGLGLLSIGIAFHSADISKKSDDKMIANANESFLKIVDVFEDKRIKYLREIEEFNFKGTEETIWKCRTYLNRAIKLMASAEIDEDNRKRMLNQYIHLLRQFPWKGKKINDNIIKENEFSLTDVKNLFLMYEQIRINHIYDKLEDEPIKYFKPVYNYSKKCGNIDEYIENMLKEIDDTKQILKEIIGEMRRYKFMKLDDAEKLKEKKVKNEKK